MSQKSQEKPAGNTKSAGKGNQLYLWVFTIPMEEYTASQLSQHLKSFCKNFVFQGEEGKETGYKHWQGCLSLKNKEYFATVKNLLGDKCHLEPTKSTFAAIRYAMKDDTRIEGPYNFDHVFVKTLDKLYDWQKSLEEELCKPCVDDRKIIWYYDEGGCKGKTQFAKYMAIRHNSTVLQNAGKGDIAMCIPDQPTSVIFLFSRDIEGYINYDAIESVKDGMIFSKKYESKMKIFNSPHVVIFANCEPDYNRLSKDRWDIRML